MLSDILMLKTDGIEESASMIKTRVQLNLWHAEESNIGHVSLYIPHNDLYVSFWPAKSVYHKHRSVQARASTYDEDVILEEQSRLEELHNEVLLDVWAMERKWREILSTRQYSLANYNCADAVMEVLKAGNLLFEKRLSLLMKVTDWFYYYLFKLFPFFPSFYSYLIGDPFYATVHEKVLGFKAKGVYTVLKRHGGVKKGGLSIKLNKRARSSRELEVAEIV